jgi:hypothetical protein
VISWRGGSDLAGTCGVLLRAFWVLVGVCGSLGARTRRIALLACLLAWTHPDERRLVLLIL